MKRPCFFLVDISSGVSLSLSQLLVFVGGRALVLGEPSRLCLGALVLWSRSGPRWLLFCTVNRCSITLNKIADGKENQAVIG